MMLKVISLVLALFAACRALAQADSVAFTVDSRMPDGVYISYNDFRHNTAVSKEQINSTLDKEQINFLEKMLQQKTISYTKDGMAYTTETKKIWGFFQNNTLYVNYRGDFYRVPVFGSISYLVATVVVMTPGMYDPAFGYSMGGGYTKEIREFLIDFYDGRLNEINMEQAELLLSRDKPLYEEFKAVPRRKRKEELYRFIRRYNALHPVYFLK